MEQMIHLGDEKVEPRTYSDANAISSLKWRLEQRQIQQTNLFGTPQRPCERL